MTRVLDLFGRHSHEIVIYAMVAGVVFLVAMRLLRVRLGFPAVTFGCLFVMLAGATSFGNLQVFCKGLFRWVGLAVMAGLLMVHVREARAPQNRLTAVHGGAVALLVLAFATVPLSTNQRFAAMSSVAVTMVFVAAFGTVWFYASDPRRLVEMIETLWKLGMTVIGVGVLFLVVPGIEARAGTRFQGFFNNPNWNGNFSAILLPIVLWKLRYPRDAVERRVTGLCAAALCLNTLLSGSRGAIVGAVVGGMLAQYRLDRGRLFRHVTLGVLVLAVVICSQVGREVLEARVGTLARVERLRTLTHRTEMWEAAWPSVKSRLPFGVGLGNSRFILPEERGAEMSEEVGATATHLHSQHVLMLAELGVVGLVLLWLFMFYVAMVGLRVWRCPRSPMSDLAFALFCCCVVVLGDSFLHGWMLSAGSAYALMFWMIVSLLLKAERFAGDELLRMPDRE